MANRPIIGGPGTIKARGALRPASRAQGSARKRHSRPALDDEGSSTAPPDADDADDDDDDGRVLHLRNATTDPVARPYRLPAALRADVETDYYVLQHRIPGLTDDERLAAETGYLRDGDDVRELTEAEDEALHARIKAGLRALEEALRDDDAEMFVRLMPVPVDGWIIRSSKSRAELAAIPGVHFVDTFHPAFKLTPTLYARAVRRVRGDAVSDAATLALRLTPFPWEDTAAIVAAIERLGGKARLVEQVDYQRGKPRAIDVIGAAIPEHALLPVAHLPQLHWVEEDVVPTMLLDVATERTRVRPYVGGVRAAGDPNYLGLTGAGQMLGIYDSGVDNGGLAPVPYGAPPVAVAPAMAPLIADLAGRVAGDTVAWQNPLITQTWADRFYDGTNYGGTHGTMVAGVAIGDGNHSGGLIRGVAYAANAVVRPFSADYRVDPVTNTMVFDITVALANAYARGARVHNDSWGVASPPPVVFALDQYLAPDRAIDSYTRANPQMLVVTSAGNAGIAGGHTITSPGAGKNVLTVGNSGNGIVNNGAAAGTAGAQVAPTSSRGPAPSGRLKPDLVAPGDEIAAIRSQAAAAANAYAGQLNYEYAGGTSFAAPHVSGMALLIREYVATAAFPGGPRNAPSGMLVKALLVNGATPLVAGADPNDDEGWGRANLERSIDANLILAYDSCDPNDPANAGQAFYLTPFLHRSRGFDLNLAGVHELSITLAWYDRPDGGGVGVLVNDLDLVLRRNADGHIYRGGRPGFLNGVSRRLHGFQRYDGAFRDQVNSVEKIHVVNPANGAYRLTVRAATIPGFGHQVAFAVVVRAV